MAALQHFGLSPEEGALNLRFSRRWARARRQRRQSLILESKVRAGDVERRGPGQIGPALFLDLHAHNHGQADGDAFDKYTGSVCTIATIAMRSTAAQMILKMLTDVAIFLV